MHYLDPRATARFFHTLLLAVLLAGPWSWLHAAERHTTVTAPDGVTLAVQESGDPDGPPVILIHGLLGSHLNWQAQRASPALQRFRLITFDLRGHGLSGKPRDPLAYREGSRWADDLAAVIKATGARKPVLVGWSLGAAVISNYLARHGDGAIGGVIYANGVIQLDDPAQSPSHPAVYAGLNAAILSTRLDAQRAFLALCFQVQPERAAFERLLGAAAMAAWEMPAQVPSMDIALDGLARARVPVLLLYGARDALVNTVPALARARALNPRAAQLVYAESGHAPFAEEPERFARDLARFVDAAQRAGAH